MEDNVLSIKPIEKRIHFYDDIEIVNKILSSKKNVYFMNAPISNDVNGNALDVKQLVKCITIIPKLKINKDDIVSFVDSALELLTSEDIYLYSIYIKLYPDGKVLYSIRGA